MTGVEEIRSHFRKIINFEPYWYQTEAWQHIESGHNTIIAAGTGAGKTEAALVPALATGKRLILLFPTKALIQDQLERVQKLASHQGIAVDTGDEDDLSYYHADVILTNLDKFLYRMFGYGKRRYSYLFPYRIAGIGDDRRPLLMFDEAHAYEEVILSHFWFVLKKLTYERQVQTLLLSATLPTGMLQALRDTERRYFPRPFHEGDFFHVVEDKEIRTGRVFSAGFVQSGNDAVDEAWKAYQQRKRVIMVVRSVVKPAEDEDETEEPGGTLQEVWVKLVERASALGKDDEIGARENGKVTGSILTYHGHQLPSYRCLVLDRLKELDHAKRPFLLLTTSAMEVGVDVSCDVMVTDLCEPDSFVQRIGRCARRKGETGKVYVAEAGPALPRTASLRDYLYRLLDGTEIDAARKGEINTMNMPPELDSVHLRLEYVQDVALYRYIYDFVQENKQVWEHGLLVTREWEPCIPVVQSERRNGETCIGGIPEREFWRGKELKDKTLLSVSCAADIAPYCAWIFDTFNDEFHHPQRVPVGGKQERSLKEALMEAGYHWRSDGRDDNKSREVYAVGIPLVLLLGAEVSEKVYKDDNLGFAYRRRFVKPTKRSPSPLLRARQVELQRSKGLVRLPLYWFEPVEGG